MDEKKFFINGKWMTREQMERKKAAFFKKYADFPFPRPLDLFKMEVTPQQFREIKAGTRRGLILWGDDIRVDDLCDPITTDWIENGPNKRHDNYFYDYAVAFRATDIRKVKQILIGCGDERLLADVTGNYKDLPSCEDESERDDNFCYDFILRDEFGCYEPRRYAEEELTVQAMGRKDSMMLPYVDEAPFYYWLTFDNVRKPPAELDKTFVYDRKIAALDAKIKQQDKEINDILNDRE